MNYSKIYNNLIIKAVSENRKKLKKSNISYVYYERHHIIPRCMDGTDELVNLVNLTPEEHFLAHRLLVKIHPNENLLIYALHMMTVSNSNQLRNNKQYGWIKKLRKNITLSEKSKKHLSEINTGKKHSFETKEKIRQSRIGDKLSTETKEKIGRTNSKIINDKILNGEHIVWNLGIEMTEDTKKYLSESLKNTYKSGRKKSSSCFQKGRVPWNKGLKIK